MADIRFFQHMSLQKMMKMFTEPGDVTVDINKMGEVLDVSVLPHNLSKYQVSSEAIKCVFITNEKGNSCIFYGEEMYSDPEHWGRVFVMMAFARYITTCQKEFVITENVQLSQREKTLVYEMLMPQAELKETINKLLMPTTYSLGKIFQVPQDFVRERLKDLKIPTMIAGYDF